jgi:DNA-binding response OmpR family regulator
LKRAWNELPVGGVAAAIRAIDPMTYFEVNKTVLVVDDDSQVRDEVALSLSREGCCIQTAIDAESAYRIMRHDPPDVVLLDADLPELDIAEFNSLLLELNPKAKLLLTTSARGKKKSGHGSGLGVLTKPFRESELLSAVGPCKCR